MGDFKLISGMPGTTPTLRIKGFALWGDFISLSRDKETEAKKTRPTYPAFGFTAQRNNNPGVSMGHPAPTIRLDVHVSPLTGLIELLHRCLSDKKGDLVKPSSS